MTTASETRSVIPGRSNRSASRWSPLLCRLRLHAWRAVVVTQITYNGPDKLGSSRRVVDGYDCARCGAHR